MRKDEIFIRNKQIIARQIQGEFVVLDINAGKLYKLNETAKVIWKFLAKPRSTTEIVEKVVTKFDVQEKVAKKEVQLFVNEHLGSLFFNDR